MHIQRLVMLLLLSSVVPQSAVGDTRQVSLQPLGIHRYSAQVTFDRVSGTRLYLIDTGAAYSLVPRATLDALLVINAATRLGEDLVRAVDGRTFHLDKFRLARMNVGECALNNVVVYASPANRGILGMSTLSRFSPFTLDIEAQLVSLNCSEP